MDWRIVCKAGHGSGYLMEYCEASGTSDDGIFMRRGEPVSAHWVTCSGYVGLQAGMVADGSGTATTSDGLLLAWGMGRSDLVIYTFEVLAFYGLYGGFERREDGFFVFLVDFWYW